MLAKHLIYALVDPDSREVRYVGRSSSGLHRPKQHLAPSNVWGPSRSTRLYAWVREVVARGLVPEVVVLERLEPSGDVHERLNEAERAWVSAFRRAWGRALTNMTEGGDAEKGRPIDPEVREKISAALRGRPKSEAHRLRLSRALVGREPSERSLRALAEFRRRPKSPSHRAAIAAAQEGRSFPPDWSERVSRAKAESKKPVVCLNDRRVFESVTAAARAYGVDKACVSAVCHRRQLRTGRGLVFRFVRRGR